MDRIGIFLIDARPESIRYSERQECYFFCEACAKWFKGKDWKIWDVYSHQFPENWGQKCHAAGCRNILKEGLVLYDDWQEIQIPDGLL